MENLKKRITTKMVNMLCKSKGFWYKYQKKGDVKECNNYLRKNFGVFV